MNGGPGENAGRRYHEMVDPLTADKRNRIIPALNLRLKIIRLDNALIEQEIKVAGDFFYFDINSTGVGTIKLNNTSEFPIPAVALSGLENVPYDGLYFSCAAQAGLVLNLWYGYNAQFQSPTSAIATIGSITNPVKISDTNGNSIDSVGAQTALTSAMRYALIEEGGHAYGTSFSSVTVRAANSPENIIAAGSNTNGYVLWAADYKATSATLFNSTILAKAGVPATAIDGDVLVGATTPVGQYADLHLLRAVRVASGKALDRISSQLETNVLFCSLHSLF